MNKYFANFFVFTTGAVIMAIELTASRLLAPYFGTSIFVWGNIIGVVMIALALGYWWGGKLADKKPRIQVLSSLIFICAIFLTLLPIFFKPLVKMVISILEFPSLFVFAFICFWVVIFILALPLIILGMSSPFVIRIMNKDVKDTGKVAGQIFAWATIGSIFGVFLSTFITVPFLGSMETILISAAVLILLSGLTLPSKYKLLSLLVILPVIVYIFFANKPLTDNENLVFEKETPYQYVRVVDKEGWRYLLFNEGSGIQSYIKLNRPHFLTDNSYYDYFNFLPYINHQEDYKKDFLIIGGGGGTAAKQLVSFWQPKINIDFVEIDKTVIEAAQQYFDMNEKEINVINQDGRFFLEKTEKKYDYLIVDAYSNQLFIPFHVTTDEFFHLTKSKLNQRGVLSININADGHQSELLQKMEQTVKKNFKNVYVLPMDNSYNFLVFASDVDLDFEFELDEIDKDLHAYAKNFANIEEISHWQKDMILTDNRAPIEFLTDKMILKIFFNYIMGES